METTHMEEMEWFERGFFGVLAAKNFGIGLALAEPEICQTLFGHVKV